MIRNSLSLFISGFIATAAVTLSGPSAFAQLAVPNKIEAFRYEEMDAYLKQTNFSPLLKPYTQAANPLKATGEVIPDSIKEIFTRLQIAAFGTDSLISLSACADCHAEASLVERTIYVEVKFMNRVLSATQLWEPRSAVAFILAHELGHFVQEFSGRNKEMLDINGLPPLFSVRPQNGMTIRDLRPFFEAHAEVDTYGLLIMKKAGYRRHDESAQTLRALRTNYWLNQADIDVRLARIASSLNLLWPRAPLGGQ